MNKVERLETALLDYIEKNVEDTTIETAATIPEAAKVLVELWKSPSFSDIREKNDDYIKGNGHSAFV